ncbi:MULTISPECIES: ATP-binding protein [Streptomyces]|uniref:ATP-binding protein n=1 Tax=Streptomyces TaxID=1883 RepID=UPI0034323E3C
MSPATAVARAAADTLPQSSTSRSFEVSFAPAPACVACMRRITAAFLDLWNVPGPLAENIVLAVSELVTNAVEHGKGGVGLRVRYPDNELRIEVTDGNPTPAKMRRAADNDASGRGLLLVTVLAHEWGVSDGGTTTWCVFRAPAGRS